MASLFISFLAGLRWEQDMDSPRKPMVTDYFIGYWTVFWSSLHGSFNDSIYRVTVLFKHYKTVTVKNFIIANV
jgi:hypothetical protein